MHIDAVPNCDARPTYLLRESFRKGDRVRKRTLANLSALSDEQIAAIRRVLRSKELCAPASLFEVVASRPHGHVQAVSVAMQRLGIERLLVAHLARERGLVLAMITARIVAPHTKLATTRWWHTTTLAEDFDVADADEDDLYAAMGWPLARQDTIQKKLAGRDAIGLSVGKVINQYKVAKHFELTIDEDRFSYARDQRRIAEEAALDGIYLIRTSVGTERMDAPDCVRNYKALAQVEWDFRCLKMIDLKVRPIHHRTADRVRTHMLL